MAWSLIPLAVLGLAASEFAVETRLRDLKRFVDFGLWNDRIRALYELEDLGAGALPLLVYSLADADWQVRLTAVHFLGKAGPAASETLGEVARREHCPYVRLAALDWLRHLGIAGRAQYDASITPEDQEILDGLPLGYARRMGRPVAVQMPDGRMPLPAFRLPRDAQVCASSLYSGHRRREIDLRPRPPAPRIAKRPAPRPEPKPEPPRELKPEETLSYGFTPPSRPAAPAPRPETPQEKRRNAVIDELLAPGMDASTETLSAAPGVPRKQAAPVAAAADEAAAPARSQPAPAVAAAARPSGPRETLSAGFAPVARKQAESPAGPEIAAHESSWKNPHDPVPELLARLQLKNALDRARAADELGRQGQAATPALKALARALKDRDPRVRASAALALGNLGVKDKKVVKALRKALKDKDEDVRFSARLALDRIESASDQ